MTQRHPHIAAALIASIMQAHRDHLDREREPTPEAAHDWMQDQLVNIRKAKARRKKQERLMRK